LLILSTTLTIGPTTSIIQELKVAPAAQSGVVIYTHPDCAYSAAAKMEYRRNKVAYVEIDISKQRDKIPELLEFSNGERVTPVIVENGQVTIGFKGGY
jgi:glutaredoxin 3